MGVGIGAAIHNWIPQSVIETIIGKGNPFAVILVTLVGVPMYADIFGTLPIAEALFGKGNNVILFIYKIFKPDRKLLITFEIK